MQICSFFYQLKNGCAKLEIRLDDLHFNEGIIGLIELTASVTEEGTKQVESSSKRVHMNNNPLSIQWDYRNRYIKRRLPYRGEVQITDVNVKLDDLITVELCYDFDSYILSGSNMRTCTNHTMDPNKKLKFTIPPLKNISQYSLIGIKVGKIFTCIFAVRFMSDSFNLRQQF